MKQFLLSLAAMAMFLPAMSLLANEEGIDCPEGSTYDSDSGECVGEADE